MFCHPNFLKKKEERRIPYSWDRRAGVSLAVLLLLTLLSTVIYGQEDAERDCIPNEIVVPQENSDSITNEFVIPQLDCPPILTGASPDMSDQGLPVAVNKHRRSMECRSASHEYGSEVRLFTAAISSETAGGTFVIPSTTLCTTEEMSLKKAGFSADDCDMHSGSSGSNGTKAIFGTDIHVKIPNGNSPETNSSLASDSEGNYYLAFQDISLSRNMIWIYWSNDGGEHWMSYSALYNSDTDLREPCITIGTGIHDVMLVTYIVDDGVNMPYPEVATSTLHSKIFDFHSVPVWAFEDYAKPVIWTDCSYYQDWRAYLTCEGIFDSAAENINVCTWRSVDQGDTWGDEAVPLGSYDAYPWRDPDGSFGSSKRRLFVTCFNDYDDTLYCLKSLDNCGTWSLAVTVYTLTEMPTWPVDPEVEASAFNNHVLICCTKSFGGNDNIGTSWSTDCGDSWGYLYSLSGYTAYDEFAPNLHANPLGTSWHLTYTSQFHCYYSKAPQDMSSYFQPMPDEVDDATQVSHNHSKKGITCTWDSDVAGITWADYRDALGDYDTYFDHPDDPTRIYVPDDYATIQAAIDASVDGQIIHVFEGTYYENIRIKTDSLRLRATYGPSSTVIDGGQNGTVVTIPIGVTNETVIEGFKITNGNSMGGGGIHCWDASPVIRGNVIENNETSNFGGGIFMAGNGLPTIEHNCICHNHSTNSYGGGVYLHECKAWVKNNHIYGNSGAQYGGGITCNDTPSILVNNTIHDNSAVQWAGGIYVRGTATPQIRNTIIWNNDAPTGPGIYDNSGTGTLVVEYCDVQEGWPGVGNIKADPCFETYMPYLRPYSPCINMGTDAGAPVADFFYMRRPNMGTADMGAFEFYGTHCLGTDSFEIDESEGAVIDFKLKTTSSFAGRTYMIFAGVTGTAPGTPLPNSQAVLPVNWDFFTDLIMSLVNSPVCAGFMGTLDASGDAAAELNTYGPLPPGSAGVTISFAYALSYMAPDGWFASNPVNIELVP